VLHTHRIEGVCTIRKKISQGNSNETFACQSLLKSCFDLRSLRHDKLQCHMFWEGESLLHIGWADTVKVARVRAPATGGTGEGRRSLDIVASFQIDCLIAVSLLPALQALLLRVPLSDHGIKPAQ